MTNVRSGTKSGGIKILVLILLLNILSVSLLYGYVMYPIADISAPNELSTDVSGMKVIDETKYRNWSIYVFENNVGERYVMTVERNFFGNRYRILSSGTYQLEEAPVSVSAKTISGVLKYKVSEEYEVGEITAFGEQTVKTISAFVLLRVCMLSVIEIIGWWAFTRIKGRKS